MHKCAESKIRVRYNESGVNGIVHHSAYPVWFDTAQMAFLRSIGLSYASIEASGYSFPLVESHIHFRNVAYFDDELTVSVFIKECGMIKFLVYYEVVRDRDGVLIATGETAHVFVDKSFRPVNMKKSWPELYEKLQKYSEDR